MQLTPPAASAYSLKMARYKRNYTRRLPHHQPAGAILFVTFGLAGSLPLCVEERLRREANLLRINLMNLPGNAPELVAVWKRLFHYADEHWDKSDRVFHLKNTKVATLLLEAILREHERKNYRLHRYCIMPNHVHLLVEPLPENAAGVPCAEDAPAWPPCFYTDEGRGLLTGDRTAEELIWRPLWMTMKSIKGSTAYRIGQIVGVSGNLWMPENYDHWIRNKEEYERVVDYIDNNPVKAGLCSKPSDWKFSSAGANLPSTATE